MTTHQGCTCSHDSPVAILKAEHRVIEQVLDALERLVREVRIDAAPLRDALDFLRNFADGCHHAKEENELFPRLEAAGVPREDGPIGCMLDEHERGRRFIRAMADSLDAAAAGDCSARAALCSAADGYVELLRKHIWKEDNVLFAMAERVLGTAERGAVLGGFDRTEQAPTNAGKHARYVAMAETLYHRALAASPAAPCCCSAAAGGR